MTSNPKVWFVDDLPSNLETFKRNHAEHFDIELFNTPGEVLERILKKEYPEALLCDIFFYDSVEEAEDVEKKIEKLALNLKAVAKQIGANDHTHATGIELMREIYEHFGKKAPPFPMYAYTSKGPFLLEQKEWENISKYGAEVLLKNKVTAESERLEIVGDIAVHKLDNSWFERAKGGSHWLMWALIPGIILTVVSFCIRRLITGTW